MELLVGAVQTIEFDETFISFHRNERNTLIVVSKLYGVNATIIIFVFVLYCIQDTNARH